MLAHVTKLRVFAIQLFIHQLIFTEEKNLTQQGFFSNIQKKTNIWDTENQAQRLKYSTKLIHRINEKVSITSPLSCGNSNSLSALNHHRGLEKNYSWTGQRKWNRSTKQG